MPVFRHPSALNSREFYPDETIQFIESLRRFITHDKLTERTQQYRAPNRQTNGIQIARMRENQPLIEAFEAYDKQSLRGQRKVRKPSDQILDLANVGMFCHVIGPTLGDNLTGVHRNKLIDLNGQLHPLLLEWRMAAHYANTKRAEIAWFNVDSSSPEFAVRADGVEWEVECKRISHMIGELLGDSEAAELVASIFQRLTNAGLCGDLFLQVSLDFARLTTAQQLEKISDLFTVVSPGSIAAEDPGFALLSGESPRLS